MPFPSTIAILSVADQLYTIFLQGYFVAKSAHHSGNSVQLIHDQTIYPNKWLFLHDFFQRIAIFWPKVGQNCKAFF